MGKAACEEMLGVNGPGVGRHSPSENGLDPPHPPMRASIAAAPSDAAADAAAADAAVVMQVGKEVIKKRAASARTAAGRLARKRRPDAVLGRAESGAMLSAGESASSCWPLRRSPSANSGHASGCSRVAVSYSSGPISRKVRRTSQTRPSPSRTAEMQSRASSPRPMRIRK